MVLKKRFQCLLALWLVLTTPACSVAWAQNLPEQVGQAEKVLFGHAGNSKAVELRVENLEVSLFGKSNHGPLLLRLKHINKMLGLKETPAATGAAKAVPVTAPDRGALKGHATAAQPSTASGIEAAATTAPSASTSVSGGSFCQSPFGGVGPCA